MSAPRTHIDTQEKRHRPSLIAIGAAALFGLLMILTIANTAFDDETVETNTAAPTVATE